MFAANRSQHDDEISLAMELLFVGAGFHDGARATDLSKYEARTIAGKPVYVGTTDMLTQDEHQRGRPYLYQTDNAMFLVITDDDAWAANVDPRMPSIEAVAAAA